MKKLQLFALALLVPLAGACASVEEELVEGLPAPDIIIDDFDDVAGSYTLIAYGDDELPVQTEEDDIEDCIEHVVSGELNLMENGEFEYSFVEHEFCEGDIEEEADEVELEPEVIEGEYTIADGRIFFDETENDQMEGESIVEIADLDVGWFEDGRLLVEPEDIDGIQLVFER